jgi:hypothetical protein
MQQAVIRHAKNDTANLGPETASKAGKAAPKIGEGHAAAMLRLGAHELTQALAAFPDSNIKPMEEAGVVGNPTPQLVTEEMGGYEAALADSTNRAQYQTQDRSQNRSR